MHGIPWSGDVRRVPFDAVSPVAKSPVAFERVLSGPVDALALFQAAGSRAPRFYFAPADGPIVVGVGAVETVRADSPTEAILAIERHDPDRVGTWLGGFAFDPRAPTSDSGTNGSWHAFPASLWFLPEALLVVGEDETRLTLFGPGGADRDLLAVRAASIALHVGAEHAGGGHRAGFDAAVEGAGFGADQALDAVARDAGRALEARIGRAIEAVHRGDVEKVVLAATKRHRLDAAPDIVPLLLRMREAAPGCTVFFVEPQAGHVLLGATPEFLLRKRGRRVQTMALAGSAPRGATREDDERLGSALLGSEKDQREHEVVADAIVAALRSAGGHVAPLEATRLRKLARIQHLETPISARFEAGIDPLSLADVLHPTPALGGHPRDAALALIRALEPAGRGWYGGAVGWRDAAGDSDLAVVIRALRLTGRDVLALAGAGLVAASDPAAERREIELKLRVALSPLTADLGGDLDEDPTATATAGLRAAAHSDADVDLTADPQRDRSAR